MSALPPKADILQDVRDVPFVPKADTPLLLSMSALYTRERTFDRRFAGLSFLHEPPHLFNWPILACFDHTHPWATSLIDKRVGAKLVTNFRNACPLCAKSGHCRSSTSCRISSSARRHSRGRKDKRIA